MANKLPKPLEQFPTLLMWESKLFYYYLDDVLPPREDGGTNHDQFSLFVTQSAAAAAKLY